MHKIKTILKKRTIWLIILAIIIMFVTNPVMIPFLSYETKLKLVNAVFDLSEDIMRISQIVTLNWVVFFQIGYMAIVLFIIKDVTEAILKKIKVKSRRLQTLITLTLNILQYLFVIIGAIWGLKLLGIKPSTIFAGISIVALVVGFSAESLIADIVTGIFLLFDNVYNEGDIIEVDEFRGKVIKVGVRTTSIQDDGGNIKIINNSDMRNIINRSVHLSLAVCDIALPVSADIEKVDDMVNKVLGLVKSKYAEEIKGEISNLGIQSIEENTMVIRIAAEVEEPNRYKFQRKLNRYIKWGLQKIDIWDTNVAGNEE